jgi:hypothetical protein
MINYSDLRFGNLVTRNYVGQEVTCKITGINEGYIEIQQFPHGQTFSKADPIALDPILLSGDWLLKFGFEQGDHVTLSRDFYQIKVGGSLLQINPDNGVVWFERNENKFNNPQLIKFVHQMQNLYYAMTGIEIHISE